MSSRTPVVRWLVSLAKALRASISSQRPIVMLINAMPRSLTLTPFDMRLTPH